MSSSMPSLLSRLGTAALFTLCLVASAQAGKPGTLAVTAPQAVPAITTIAGAPLTVRVGDDLSFQVFNADIPGVGQIYPSDSSDTADMGWIVHAGACNSRPTSPTTRVRRLPIWVRPRPTPRAASLR